MENKVCNGACLFGKCPFDTCIKYAQRQRQAPEADAPMQILTDLMLNEVPLDKKGFGIAVDIGTTTVAAYLYDLENGRQLSVKSRLNAQAFLGIDVISRIRYCTDIEGGLEAMREAIVKELNSFIESLTSDAGIENTDIAHMVITGNTTMLHLLTGTDPKSMGHAPFAPVSRFGSFVKASELGLSAENAEIYLADCISSFVGGDITCAVLASGLHEKEELCLLLDIGTNGEVVLGSKNGILATSTAAGPAFEGAQLKHGMASVAGAINSVSILSGSIHTTTIGNIRPKGICGSGIVDAIALFLDIGLITPSGRILKKDEASPLLARYIVQEEGMIALSLVNGITITQKDIRDIQAAKAAVAAGVLSLLDHAEKSIEDVAKVYIAGGFGNYMDAQSAVRIGLLPKEAADRIVPLGNAALAGAVLALLNNDCRSQCTEIQKAGKHVELANNPYFMEKYIECMSFDE